MSTSKFELNLWVYPNEFGSLNTVIKEINKFSDWCSKYNVNKIFLAIRRNIYAYYPSKMLLLDPNLGKINLIERIVRALHNVGTEVHAMIVVSPWFYKNMLTNIPSKYFPKFLYSDEWLPIDRYGFSERDAPFFGRTLDLDIGKESVRKFIASHVKDFLESVSEIDGIHLDFIRYRYWNTQIDMNLSEACELSRNIIKDSFIDISLKINVLGGIKKSTYRYYVKDVKRNGRKVRLEREYLYCFCNECLRNFEKSTGIEIPPKLYSIKDRADWILNNFPREFHRWRTLQVKDQVVKIRNIMDIYDKSLKLSAATFARFPPYGLVGSEKPSEDDYDSLISTIAQDWIDWINDGLLDFATPMLYWMKPINVFKAWRILMKRIGRKYPLYPGILTSEKYRYRPSQLKEIYGLLKNNNGAGITLFRYGTWSHERRKRLGKKTIYHYEKVLRELRES